MFLIGACTENSGIRVQDTLNSERFAPHPATAALLDWFTRHGGDATLKDAAKRAKTIYNQWLAQNKPKADVQRRLFDVDEET